MSAWLKPMLPRKLSSVVLLCWRRFSRLKPPRTSLMRLLERRNACTRARACRLRRLPCVRPKPVYRRNSATAVGCAGLRGSVVDAVEMIIFGEIVIDAQNAGIEHGGAGKNWFDSRRGVCRSSGLIGALRPILGKVVVDQGLRVGFSRR